MNATITAVRAIGAEFAYRSVRPLIVIGGVVLGVLAVGGAWLTTVNAWWWIAEAIVLIGLVLFVIAFFIVRAALRIARPEQTKQQASEVKQYVDKLQRVAENLQTPQFVILFRVIRDVVRPRPNSFIKTISLDSKSLAPDFEKLVRQFS